MGTSVKADTPVFTENWLAFVFLKLSAGAGMVPRQHGHHADGLAGHPRATVRSRLGPEAEVLALRHQRGVLQRQAPHNPRLRPVPAESSIRLDRPEAALALALGRAWPTPVSTAVRPCRPPAVSPRSGPAPARTAGSFRSCRRSANVPFTAPRSPAPRHASPPMHDLGGIAAFPPPFQARCRTSVTRLSQTCHAACLFSGKRVSLP